MKRTLSLIALLVVVAGALALYGSAIAAAEPKATDFGRAECDRAIADACVISIAALDQRNETPTLCASLNEDDTPVAAADETDACDVRHLAGR